MRKLKNICHSANCEHQFINSKTCPSGEFGSIHFSNEIYYIVKGTFLINVEGYSFTCTPGTVLYLPSNLFHSIRFDKDENIEIYNLRFSKDLIPLTYHKAKYKKPIQFKELDDFATLLYNINRQTDMPIDEFNSFLVTIIPINFQIMERNLDKTIKPNKNEVVIKVVNYFKKNLNIEKSLLEIAKEVNYSAKEITNEFKTSLNITPLLYRSIIRIIKAKNKIINGKSPKEVYKEFGYSSYHIFYKQCLKILGCNPSENNIITLDDSYRSKFLNSLK